jgi:hypothetical protein
MRTGGLGVSTRLMGPEEGGIVEVSRTPGLGLIGIFAVGFPHWVLLLLPRMEADNSGKGGYSGT